MFEYMRYTDTNYASPQQLAEWDAQGWVVASETAVANPMWDHERKAYVASGAHTWVYLLRRAKTEEWGDLAGK